MFARISSQTLGYGLAALIMVPLIIWAKHSQTGLWALCATVGLVFLWCIAVRIRTGYWPGDEPC